MMETRVRSAACLVTDLFAIIDGQHWERLGEVFDPEVRYERPGFEPILGIDSLETFYRKDRIIASGRHEVEQVVCDVAAVACWGRFRGESRDGEVLDELFADTYLIRAHLIVRRRTFFYRPAI
jgi:uncharacterized protein